MDKAKMILVVVSVVSAGCLSTNETSPEIMRVRKGLGEVSEPNDLFSVATMEKVVREKVEEYERMIDNVESLSATLSELERAKADLEEVRLAFSSERVAAHEEYPLELPKFVKLRLISLNMSVDFFYKKVSMIEARGTIPELQRQIDIRNGEIRKRQILIHLLEINLLENMALARETSKENDEFRREIKERLRVE